MSFGRVYQYSTAVQAHSAAHFWDIDYTGIIKAGDIKGTFLRVWEDCGVCIRNILGCQVHIIAIVLYRKRSVVPKKPTHPLLGGWIMERTESTSPLYNIQRQPHEHVRGDQKVEGKSGAVRQDQASCTSREGTLTITGWCAGVCPNSRKNWDTRLNIHGKTP